MTDTRQVDTDVRNKAFWEEMCGSVAAKTLGISDCGPESLAKFDRWYFEFYPYLDRFIDFADVRGKDVLEVGLGYGSVSQRLAESGARLVGLDIAAGPVAGVSHRLRQCGLPGEARQGSILNAPFPDASFDVIVAIGCYHHTGNLPKALAETARLLRPGGRATIMIYNATGYVRWILEPGRTWRYALAVATGDPAPLRLDTDSERATYDKSVSGNAAPETVVVSKPHFERLLRQHFESVSVARVNAIAHRPFTFIPRSFMLATVGPILGLDLYARVRKQR